MKGISWSRRWSNRSSSRWQKKTKKAAKIAAVLVPLIMLPLSLLLAKLPLVTAQSAPSTCTPPTTPRDPGCDASITPNDPKNGVYVLNWELAADRTVPPAPPRFWRADYCAATRHADSEPQIRAQDRRAPGSDPKFVRTGRYSARFQLERTDPLINNGSKRAELKASACSLGPPNVERWYAFSIFLPNDWQEDPDSGEILTQWHQDDSTDPRFGGSPPLALMIKDQRWFVSVRQKTWDNTAPHDPRDPVERRDGTWTIDIPIAPYQRGVWTDWVVHAKWSADPSNGKLQIWMNRTQRTLRYEYIDGVVDMENAQNKFDDGKANYMKFGIYKWDWAKAPADDPSITTKRVIYYDDLRIAAGENKRELVTPPPAADCTRLRQQITAVQDSIRRLQVELRRTSPFQSRRFQIMTQIMQQRQQLAVLYVQVQVNACP